MKKSAIFTFFIFLLLPSTGISQATLKPYLNAGYVTNFKPCHECERADGGGSVRIGVLTEGRLGFYAGYLWVNRHPPDYIEYQDRSTLFMAGIDFRFLKTGDLHWYVKAGLGYEEFTSTYPNRVEKENSFKPDFGILLNYRFFNVFAAWGPSDPPLINFGIGFTLYELKLPEEF